MFCERDEIAQLKDVIINKNNVLLTGEHGIGTTTLIQQVFHQLPEHSVGIYIDVFAVTDDIDFIHAFYQALVHQLPLQNTEKELQHYFPCFTASFTRKNQSEHDVSEATSSYGFDELLVSIFSGIDLFCQEYGYSHLILAFDDFQQIAEIKKSKIDAKIRAISQANKQVCFIFASNKKYKLRAIINGYGQPLYGMTTPITLKPINKTVLKSYCEKHFQLRFTHNSFLFLYKKLQGRTRPIIQTCTVLSFLGKVISNDEINVAIDHLMSQYAAIFKDKYTALPRQQKKAIKAIIFSQHLSPNTPVFARDILMTLRLTKASLVGALLALEKKDEIMQVDEGKYRINDVLYALWLNFSFSGAQY